MTPQHTAEIAELQRQGSLRRYWQLVVIALLALIAAASLSVQLISNANSAADRREQLCKAIPTAAGAGAQALVDIAISNARAAGESPGEIAQKQLQGAGYVSRARLLATQALDFCPPSQETLP